MLGDSGDHAALLASLAGTNGFVRPYTSKIKIPRLRRRNDNECIERGRIPLRCLGRQKTLPLGPGGFSNGSQVIMRGRRLPLESPWGL